MTPFAALLAVGWLLGAPPVIPPAGNAPRPAVSTRPAAAPVAASPHDDGPRAQRQAEGGFLRHLEEAIALNEARKDYYAARSGGRSLWLSTVLIAMERFSRGVAADIDRRAWTFQQRGIPVISDDFVPMRLAAARDERPRYRQVAGSQHVAELQRAIDAYRPRLAAALDGRDLRQAAALTIDLLERVEAMELDAQAHFAMTRHVCESIGIAAVNGLAHAAASQGETLALSIELIRLQDLALLSSLWIDQQAQRCHALGVGIIVNDVPHIPFVERWRQLEGAANPT